MTQFLFTALWKDREYSQLTIQPSTCKPKTSAPIQAHDGNQQASTLDASRDQDASSADTNNSFAGQPTSRTNNAPEPPFSSADQSRADKVANSHQSGHHPTTGIIFVRTFFVQKGK